MSMPWFRVYHELLSDRKIGRACRSTGQPAAVVVGVWTILLCMASESPRRGRLLVSDDPPMPIEETEIEIASGLDPVTVGKIIASFHALGLVETAESGELVIASWHKRQFPSDGSTARVRRYRQRQRQRQGAADDDAAEDGGAAGPGNGGNGGDGGNGGSHAAAASPRGAGTAVPSSSPTAADDGRAALVSALQEFGVTKSGARVALAKAAKHWPGEQLETAVLGWIEAARMAPTVSNRPGFVREALENGWQLSAAAVDLAKVETAVSALLRGAARGDARRHLLEAGAPNVATAVALLLGVCGDDKMRHDWQRGNEFLRRQAVKAAVSQARGREQAIIDQARADMERRRRYDALREADHVEFPITYASAKTDAERDALLANFEQRRKTAVSAAPAGD